jgi:hypothetical protein
MEENTTEVTEVTQEDNQVQQMQEKQAAMEAARKQIEALRIPIKKALEGGDDESSVDVIQRLNALTNLLNLKISIPKYTQTTSKGKTEFNLTGSAEISVFPFYGEYDQQYLNWCTNAFSNMIVRVTELATKL